MRVMKYCPLVQKWHSYIYWKSTVFSHESYYSLGKEDHGASHPQKLYSTYLGSLFLNTNHGSRGFESSSLLSLVEVLLCSLLSAANSPLINGFMANDKFYLHPTAIHLSIHLGTEIWRNILCKCNSPLR